MFGSDPISYIETGTQGTIFLSPADECGIKHIIDSLKSNSAPAPDYIKPQSFRFVASILGVPLTYVYNSILCRGLFPDKLKIAHVTAIHQGGSEDDLNNYRPIPLLSVFENILESLMHNNLTQNVNHFNLVSPKQLGFAR